MGLGFRLESKDQRRSNALLSLCWQSWTSSSFYAQPPFHHRVPLYRMHRPIEALKERGFTRQALEWKYGSMTPRSFKDAPEPLTNYLDVSEKGLVRNPPTHPTVSLAEFLLLVKWCNAHACTLSLPSLVEITLLGQKKKIYKVFWYKSTCQNYCYQSQSDAPVGHRGIRQKEMGKLDKKKKYWIWSLYCKPF